MATQNGAYGPNDTAVEESGAYSPNDKPFDPAKKPSGALRKLGDMGLGFVQGAAGGTKALTDAAGANNRVSRALGAVAKGAGDLMSQDAQDEIAARQATIKEAEASGSTMNEIGATLGGIAEAPGRSIATGLGSIVPTAAAALLTRGRSLAPLMGIGAVQGAGAVKGSIYDAVEQKQIEAGMTPQQAAQAADQAQAYTKDNAGNIAVGAGLGAFASRFGAEGAIVNAAGKGAALGAVRRIGKAAGEEALTEGAQGGQERYSSNVAEQRQGFNTPTFQGVAGQAVGEGVIGGIVGGGVGGIAGGPRQPQVAPVQEDAPVQPADPAAPVDQFDPSTATPANYTPGVSLQPGAVDTPLDTPAPVTKSQAMGINPAAGPTSAAAAVAVDSGATEVVQRQQAEQQAAEQAAIDAKGKKPIQEAQNDEGSAVAPSSTPAPAAVPTGPLSAAISTISQPPGDIDAPSDQAEQVPPQRVEPTQPDATAAPGVAGDTQQAGQGSIPDAGTGQGSGTGPSLSDTYDQGIEKAKRAFAVNASPSSETDDEFVRRITEEVRASTPEPAKPADASPVQAAAEGESDAIDAAAHTAATSPTNDLPEPTDAQKEAGNYKKGRVQIAGMDISIENPRGSTRSGTRPDGSTWSREMSDHYGYVKRSTGADGEQVDVYVGPKPDSQKVFVIDQLDQQTGNFDEHKAMLSYDNQMQAMRAYRSNFDKGWKVGPVTAMTVDEFKTWVKDGPKNQALAQTESAPPVGKPRTASAAGAGQQTPVLASETSVLPPATQSPDQSEGSGKTVQPSANDTTAPVQAPAKPSRGPAASQAWVDEGNTPDDLRTEKVNSLADELAGQVTGESSEKDFKPAELPAAIAQWAKDGNVPADDLRQAMLKSLDKRGLSDGRMKQIRDALDPIKQASKAPGSGLKKMREAKAKKDAASAAKPPEATEGIRFVKKANGYQKASFKTSDGMDGQVGIAPPGWSNSTGKSFEVIIDRVGGAKDEKGRTKFFPTVTVGKYRTANAAMVAARAAVEKYRASDPSTKPESPAQVEATPAPVEAPKAVESKSEKPATPKPEAKGKIEDSGEVIEGARKDYAKAYADKLDEGIGMDTAAVPLSKSWPEPDYQKLIEDGADPWMVGMVRAARDEIPNKPSKSWKLKGWADKVETLRAVSKHAMSGNFTKAQLIEHGNGFHLKDWFSKIDLYEAVGHSKSLKGFTLASGSYGIYNGEKFNPPKTLWRVNSVETGNAFGNWGKDWAVGDTKAEAVEKFKKAFADQPTAPEAKATTKFDIYSYRGKPGFVIGKKVGKNTIDLKTFDTVKEAREFKANNQAELERLLAQAKEIPPERRETNEPRVGAEHRTGGDVTTEQFRETFGFRGEQFGASMPQGERQSNLNQTYDALMDLAGVIGVPPRALSLNGELGMAFGARGKGGKRPAAAHYEPDTTGKVDKNRVVINLTREHGAGSLAHEWMHSVDNYFARMRGEKGGMLTEKPYPMGEGVRPEMVQAFKELMQAINGTSLQQRSKNLDKKRTKAYWSTGLEMAARSFESYVIAKLQDQNASNDYLANIVSEQEFNRENEYPYLTAAEIPAVRAAFDSFFNTVQTKQDDAGNVAMFARERKGEGDSGLGNANINPSAIVEKSIRTILDQENAVAVTVKGGNSNVLAQIAQRFGKRIVYFRTVADRGPEDKEVGARTGGAQPDASADAAGQGAPGDGEFITNGFVNTGRPDVVFLNVDSSSDLRDVLDNELGGKPGLFRRGDQSTGMTVDNARNIIAPVARRLNIDVRVVATPADLPIKAPDDVRALYINGDIYVVAGNVKTRMDVLKAVGHEAIAHLGLRALKGRDEWTKMMNQMQLALKMGNKPLRELQKTVRAAYVDEAGEFNLSPGQESDEIAAAAVEQAIDPVTGEFRPGFGFLKGLFAKVADWLRSAGINVAFTNLELQGALVNAQRYLQEGARAPQGQAVAAARKRPVQLNRGDLKGPVAWQVQQARKIATERFAGTTVRNDSDGLEIIIPASGIKHALSGQVSPMAALAMTKLDEVVQQATFTESVPDKKGRNTIKEVRFYEVAIEAGAESAVLRVVVRVAPDGSRYYDHFELKEKAPAGQSGKQGLPDSLQPFTGAVSTDADGPSVGDRDGVGNDSALARGAGQVVTDIKQRTGNKVSDYRSLGLQTLGRRQLVDLYGKQIPQIVQYNELMQSMDADKNDAGAQADGIADRWGKLKDERQLAELMHDATLAQIDPTKDYVKGDDENFYDALTAGYAALSPEAKKLFTDARDHYRGHHLNVRQAIRDRIERSELRGPKKAELLKEMDAEFFKQIHGIYFPLSRFGDYVVVVRDADTSRSINVSRAETMNEAQALQVALRKAYPNAAVGNVLKSKEFNAGRDAVGRGFMENLYEALGSKDMDESHRVELEDMLGQLYLSAQPDLSWAKHGIHRKGTPGFSQDARRAFAQNMFHGARYLAKVRYSDLLANELSDAQKELDKNGESLGADQPKLQDVLNEMQKRHDSAMNPNGNSVSTALTSLGFVFHLGLSPASAMVNLSQTALVAYPIMGAKWGFDKSAAALLKASGQAAANKNDISSSLTVEERKAYDEAVRSGVIDVTMAHDLAGISQGDDAKVTWKLRPVMKWASFLFHHAEKFNRQVTFIASYRLAREAGTGATEAYAQAVKATYDGHFDYSATNRPRVMQGNAARVLLLFKQFGQNMIYTIARAGYLAAKGATPAERKEARKALAGILTMHASAAGALGLPLVTTLLAAASMVGGSDDEPWDAEVALRNMLADAFGDGPADVLARGLSRLTPFDVSGRVGLDRLILPDVQEGLEGQRLGESAMASALGPVAGIGISALKGLQEMSDGNWVKGLEAMAPAVLRGPLKALRYANEGVIDRSGKMVLDDVNPFGIAGQAAGFSPSDVRLAYEAKSAVHQVDARLSKRRGQLMRHWSMAALAGDEDGMADARADIQKFNEKNPSRRINPMQMAASVRTRRMQIQQAKGGVYLSRSRRDALDAGAFGMP